MPNQTYTPAQMADAIGTIGQAVLQTKTATQNGTLVPDQGYDGMSQVVVDVSGNPNYVETITGTLANPWGEADYAQLVSDVASNNATALLSVPAMNFAAYIVSNDGHLLMGGANFSGDGSGTFALDIAAFATYTSEGALYRLLMWQNGTTVDVTSMMSGSETTLTVVHHPLPEEP